MRRLLENGANSSFVHHLHDPRVPLAALARRRGEGQRAQRLRAELRYRDRSGFSKPVGQMRGVGVVFSRFLEIPVELGVAIGMVMFAVALRLTNADWAWSIRRFALGGSAFLPISFLLLPVVLFGGHEHYFHHWLHVEGDPVIDAKSAWLSWPSQRVMLASTLPPWSCPKLPSSSTC